MQTTTDLPQPTNDLHADRNARSDQVLDVFLDAELDYDPVAKGGFINHLAMSLVAVRRLGATDADVEGWFEAQTEGDFLVRRPRPDWVEADAAHIIEAGIAAAVRRRLPELVAAPHAQFFHAPIRLELAIDAGHPGQVANALRNWAGARPLPHPPSGGGDRPLRSILERLSTLPQAAAHDGAPLAEIAEAKWFRSEVASLRVDDGLLDEVAAAALAAHVRPRDFGTLHLVTGARAARALATVAAPDDAASLALHTAHALTAAWVAFGVEVRPDGSGANDRNAAPTWDRIAAAAVESRDPHVAKLVYASRLEAAATGDERSYIRLAARQVGFA